MSKNKLELNDAYLDTLEMDKKSRIQYYNEFYKSMKDPDIYIILNLLMFFGFHHFYLGKYTTGSIYFFTTISGIFLIIFGYVHYGIAILCCVFILELIELFFSKRIVKKHNDKISKKLLKELY